MLFDNLGLCDRTLAAVEAMGYAEPTPIQRDAIPHVVQGRDVVGCAQTGTGKTVAFVLPMLKRLREADSSRNGHRRVRALVVTPTRELALQIDGVVCAVAEHTGHRSAVVYGGVGYDPQLKALRKGVDVLVATPGRLLDLHERGAVDLSRVEVIVLDEADRMLDMGFWPQVRKILALLPSARQNLLFSATMGTAVMRVIASALNEPVRVEVAPAATPADAIDQVVFPVSGMQKTELLVELVRKRKLSRTLVFARTKHRADRLTRMLRRHGVDCAAIHGNRSQAQRQAALDAFRSGRHRVLVATDVVSRGIDVEGVSHVINYDFPNSPEDYIHRIGRTARAGRSGAAITFVAAEEHASLREVESHLGETLRCEDLEGFAYSADRIVPKEDRSVKTTPHTVYGGRVMGRRGRRRRVGRR